MENSKMENSKMENSKMERQYVTIAKNISKEFKAGFRKNQGALARVLELFSGKKTNTRFKVLDNISLELRKGEILGIIGRNGSGKSTLLRVLAGIYKDYTGEVKINGKLIPLIDLSAGMQSRLTMKENIFLIGSLLGLSQKTIKNKFNKIVEFAELEDFIYAKIYQFSSGMKQKLAFSIAIHCDPDILFLDEVFAVGDEHFRKKSADKIEELVKNGVSIIFISHDLKGVEKVCDRVIWLEKGKIKKEGSPN